MHVILSLLFGVLAGGILMEGGVGCQSNRTVAMLKQDFTIKLFQQIAGDGSVPKDTNSVYSPMSVAQALAMLKLGTKGSSLQQLQPVLVEFKTSLRASPPPGSDGIGKGGNASPSAILESANGVFNDIKFQVKSDYVTRIKEDFGASSMALDMTNDPRGAEAAINRWVAKATRDKIQSLLAQGSIEPRTRLFLINAFYFKGLWEDKFDKKNTLNRRFTTDDGLTSDIPMMTGTKKVEYSVQKLPHQNDIYLEILKLNYQGGQYSMIFLLPPQGKINQLIAGLTPGYMSTFATSLYLQTTMIAIPVFKATSEIKLKLPLTKLGISDIFSLGKADLGGISDEPNLVVDEIFQKAYVDINEEGTEAAAATGISIMAMSMPPSFEADRPFLYYLRDNTINEILFLGKFVKKED